MRFWQRVTEQFEKFAGPPVLADPQQWWADQREAGAIARYLRGRADGLNSGGANGHHNGSDD
jgi:hypothetical protein